MHAQRHAFALRLLLFGVIWCLVPAFIWWALATVQKQNLTLRPQLPENTTVSLPDEKDRTLLRLAIAWTEAQPAQAAIELLDASLLSPRKEGRAATNLTMILSRGRERLAMIDGRVFRQGDTLPDGRVIQNITPQGVMLRTGGQVELTPWIPPLSVHLEKAADPSPIPTAPPPSDVTAVADPVRGTTMTLDAQQAMQLLKQLETMQRHAN